MFSIPTELARKCPALSAQDIVDIGEYIRQNQEAYPATDIKDIYRISFIQFLSQKGIEI